MSKKKKSQPIVENPVVDITAFEQELRALMAKHNITNIGATVEKDYCDCMDECSTGCYTANIEISWKYGRKEYGDIYPDRVTDPFSITW